MSSTAGWMVIGAGGHGKVVLATLLELGEPIVAVLDDEPAMWGCDLLGKTVRGPVAEHLRAGDRAVLAVGDNAMRRQLSDRFAPNWRSVVHPTAWVHPSVALGDGTFVAAGAMIQPATVLGDHVIVNTGATIDHDCVVGRYAHVAPGAHLAGDVRIGEGSLIGLGAGVTPRVVIGDWSVLGAGAIAVGDLEPGVTAVGVPAQVTGASDADPV